jgi:hypothetical protein
MLLDRAFDGYKKHMMDYHKVKEQNIIRHQGLSKLEGL